MASGLIPKLNALVGNTPDQIVSRLNNNGWIRGCDITQEILDRWGPNCRLRLTEYYGHVLDPWWTSGASAGYSTSTWRLRIFNTDLKGYWFKPYEEPFDDLWPDPASELEYRRNA